MRLLVRMLTALSLCTLAITLSCTPVAALGDERILSYHSDITVRKDATLLVRETVKVRSAGLQIRHGIYRDFPTRYQDRYGNNVKIDFRLLEVLRDSRPEPYHTASLSNGKRIYAGEANTLLAPGEYTYTIAYEVDRELGFFRNHDELYWNVTGNGWVFPMDQVSAEIKVEGLAAAQVMSYTAYTGPQGAAGEDYQAAVSPAGSVAFAVTRPLGSYEGLTIVVSWPKGLVAAPTQAQRLGWLFKDNWGLPVLALGLILVFVFFLRTWQKVGRDPAPGVVIPRYEPPLGHSPASVRYVSRMGFDHKILAATIINMAVKGFLTIRQDKREYSIQSANGDATALSPAEQIVARKLIIGEMPFVFKDENYQEVSAALTGLKDYLKKKFQGTLFVTNAGVFGLGALFTCLVLAAGIAAMATGALSPVLGAIGLITLITLLPFFYYLLKAPTKQGREIMDQIEGFKLYLSVAEKDRLNLLNPPAETPELFEKYLPYALALGVEQDWAERFAGVLARAAAGGQTYHPIWYVGDHWNALHVGGFASSMSSGFANAISSSSSPPGSSSGGSGGSSGGGGGGGGGGGW